MALVTIIKEIIKEAYHAPDMTRVAETNVDAKGKPFIMERPIENRQGLPYILLRFDGDPAVLFPYFMKGHGLRRMCDYILFAERADGTNWCLLIELKKGKDDAMEQLNAGETFAQFLVASAARAGKDIASDDVQFRKIRVGENVHSRRHQRVAEPQYENGYINLVTDALQLRHLLR